MCNFNFFKDRRYPYLAVTLAQHMDQQQAGAINITHTCIIDTPFHAKSNDLYPIGIRYINPGDPTFAAVTWNLTQQRPN